jgi:hypothetical protein
MIQQEGGETEYFDIEKQAAARFDLEIIPVGGSMILSIGGIPSGFALRPIPF